MRIFLRCLVLLFAALPGAVAAQEPGFVRHTLLNGRVTIDLPVSLPAMPEELKRIKYPGANKPAVAFSDESGSVSFALSLTEHRLAAGDVPIQTARMRSQMERVPRILRWHATEVIQIGGREVGLLDFDSQAIDSEIRNKMLLIELGGRLLLVTFNMTRHRKPEWAPVGTAPACDFAVFSKYSQ